MINLAQRGIADLSTLDTAPEEERALLAQRVTGMRLEHNALTTLGTALQAFAALTDIDVSFNQLDSLSSSTFPRPLKRLNVSRNRLSSLEGLEQCTALEHLDASSNRLTSLRGLPVNTVAARFTLLVADNMLTSAHRIVANAALRGVITEVDVRRNKFAAVDALCAFADCPALRQLDVRGNPVIEAKPQCTSIFAVLRRDVELLPSPNQTLNPSSSYSHAQRSTTERRLTFTTAAPTAVAASNSDSDSAAAMSGGDDEKRQHYNSGVTRCDGPLPLRLSNDPPAGVASLGTSLDATVQTLREALMLLQLERSTSARLRGELRVERRRGDDLHASAKSRGAEVERLRSELADMTERCAMLEQRLQRAVRERPPDAKKAMVVRRHTQHDDVKDTAARHRAGMQRKVEDRVDVATSALEQLGVASPRRSPNQRSNHDTDQLQSMLTQRDEYIDALSAENDELAFRLTQLLAERLTTTVLSARASPLRSPTPP